MTLAALPERMIAYIGTYTSRKSEGIYLCEFSTATGKLEVAGTASELENPSYLCVSNNGRYLYAVMEVQAYKGETGGAVGAYSIDSHTGMLGLINVQPTKGKDPCHLGVNRDNTFLFAANYNEGTAAVFPLREDGGVGSFPSILVHEGSGPVKGRQEAPHVHYVTLTPDEKYLCAVDLGTDRIEVYDFDQKSGCAAAAKNRPVMLRPGSGPRHMAFHPNGKFAYVLTELESDLTVFEYAPSGPLFHPIQRVSALPPDFKGVNYCAAVHISPCGNFLYASNRGHDSIAVFKITPATGRLIFISHFSTEGKFPRDFSMDPTGRFLFALNQDSDTVVPFAVMPESGRLEQIGAALHIPCPICMVFTSL